MFPNFWIQKHAFALQAIKICVDNPYKYTMFQEANKT